VNPQHDGLGNAAATVTVIFPFYDAGLSIEYMVDGLAMHVPHCGDLALGVVLLDGHVLGQRWDCLF